MRVSLKLYGSLRRYSPERREKSEYEVQKATTVRALLEELGIPERDWWMIAVNDVVVNPDRVLQEGDEVEVFEPVGGG